MFPNQTERVSPSGHLLPSRLYCRLRNLTGSCVGRSRAVLNSCAEACVGSRAGSIPAEGSERKLDTAGGEFHPALKISDFHLRTHFVCCQYQGNDRDHRIR